MEEVVLLKVQEYSDSESDVAEWNLRGFSDWVNMTFPLGINEPEFLKAARSGKQLPVTGSMFDGLNEAQLSLFQYVGQTVRDAYDLKVSLEKPQVLASIERYTILSAIDRLWQEHLYSMDSLRSSIGLRAYAQRDPLIEYKAEAFKLFDELMVNVKTEICHNIFRSASSLLAFEQFLHNLPQIAIHQQASAFGGGAESPAALPDPTQTNLVSEANEALAKAQPARVVPQVGRNDPCPCGSGKKYKNCCGK